MRLLAFKALQPAPISINDLALCRVTWKDREMLHKYVKLVLWNAMMRYKHIWVNKEPPSIKETCIFTPTMQTKKLLLFFALKKFTHTGHKKGSALCSYLLWTFSYLEVAIIIMSIFLFFECHLRLLIVKEEEWTYLAVVFCCYKLIRAKAKFSSVVIINSFSSVIQMSKIFSWHWNHTQKVEQPNLKEYYLLFHPSSLPLSYHLICLSHQPSFLTMT